MNQSVKKRFSVFNMIRCNIFVLIYIECFLLCFLLPDWLTYAALAGVLMSLVMIYCNGRIFDFVERQVFDSIQLERFGVQYCSGFLGDEWQRAYNEFRVDCQVKNRWFWKVFNIRLKHQVLANLILLSTFSNDLAEAKLSALTAGTKLRRESN